MTDALNHTSIALMIPGLKACSFPRSLALQLPEQWRHSVSTGPSQRRLWLDGGTSRMIVSRDSLAYVAFM
jgi:hypothetical protein